MYGLQCQQKIKHTLILLLLIFGRQAQLPIDIMYGTPRQGTHSVSQYVNKLRKCFQEVFAETHNNITAHQEHQMEVYNKQIHGNYPLRSWEFNLIV